MQTTRQRLLYVLTDFVSANIAWFAFNIIRYFTLPYNYGAMSLQNYLAMPIVIIGQCAFPVMMVLLYALSGFYNKVFFKSRLDDIVNSFGISLIGTIIIFFTVLFNDKIDDRLGNFEMILMLWLLLSIFAIMPRLWINSRTAKKIWNREIAFNALIIGENAQAKKLADDLEHKYRKMGFNVVGFLSDHPAKVDIDGLPVFDTTHLDAVTAEHHISAFIIVPAKGTEESTLAMINRLLPTGKSIYLTPDTYSVIAMRPRTSMVAGQVLIDISCADMPQSTLNIKRVSDIIFSSLALVAISPLLAAIAICIKTDSKGPVIYKQERLGYKKKPFYIYKFRSMRTDAEEAGPALSSPHDHRITKVGRVLRKYRLDELPQFWNVLKGDMSIVGPRPEREYYFNQIVERAPYFTLVHQVRPGITSWGMVKYGYASNVDEMIQRMKYEVLYIENVSFGVDIKILFYTIRTVVTGRGV